MTERENCLSLLRRQGYERVPFGYACCPAIIQKFHDKYGADAKMEEVFPVVLQNAECAEGNIVPVSEWLPYYGGKEPSAGIDFIGVGHEKGSDASFHMTRMVNPLRDAKTVQDILDYPMSSYKNADLTSAKKSVQSIHDNDRVSVGLMQMTIWEKSWYIRSMEELMMDMMSEDEMATVLLERVTEQSIDMAVNYAKCGVDILYFGDDIGMQHTIMMSEELYCKWIKPCYKKLIDTVRAIKPDILIAYHSCGFVEPFIKHLIDLGIDILNPVQPECMDFAEIHAKYGDKLSFLGTIGTQHTMPFGTPEEVRETVWKNLDIAGKKGGLYPEPTHMLEPEVPWENIEAYINACREYNTNFK